MSSSCLQTPENKTVAAEAERKPVEQIFRFDDTELRVRTSPEARNQITYSKQWNYKQRQQKHLGNDFDQLEDVLNYTLIIYLQLLSIESYSKHVNQSYSVKSYKY